MDIERRIDVAHELGKMAAQLEIIAQNVAVLAEQVAEFVALENKVRGAVLTMRVIGVVVIAGLSGMWWFLSQVVRLTQ